MRDLSASVLPGICTLSSHTDRPGRCTIFPIHPTSPLPAPSPYAGPTGGLTERREPTSRPTSPVRPARASSRVSRQRPPPVPGTHRMSLRPSTAPLRAPLPSLPASSLPALADPESDSLRAASPSVARLLTTAVTDSLSNYAARLVAESASACSPSVGGECALGTDVLEDRQEEFQCLAAASPHLACVLLASEGDPDALDIPTPRSYAEAIEGPYSSQWQAAMDAEMASWKSTGTYVDAVPPSGANIVSGMWIFRVKRPPGSPPVFKARYVARGFSPSALRLHVLLASGHSSAYSSLALSSQLSGADRLESSGPYAELVGCLMYLMTCTRPDLAYPLSIPAAKRVLRYLCSTSGMGLVLGGRSPVVLTGHADSSWADDQATQRSSQGYTFGLVLYVDNKAMLALCREQRLEHRTKHIALRYFLARELQQRGQLRLAYVASVANTADVFTKALAPCDHQRCCTQLGLVPVLPHLLTS
ncbi:unnamed protein product [Closterium sp. NIES-54]